jgi:hypothetical protein
MVATGAVLSGPGALLVVRLVGGQSSWTNVDAYVTSYRSIQVLPYLLGYLLLMGFVLFTAACHAGAEPAMYVRTSAALVLTGVYAALVFTNYTIQLGYVPRVLQDRPAYIAELTMANPASFAWFLEMFGYAAMGAATWFVSGCFGGGRRADLVRLLLIGNGVLSIAGAVCTALVDRWVFSPSGLVCFAVWNVVIAWCFTLIAASRSGALLAPPTQRSRHEYTHASAR